MLFIVIGGVNASGLPGIFWNWAAPVMTPFTQPGPIAIYSIFVLIGCNVFSNVPLVQLINPFIVALAAPNDVMGRYLLAWVSTIAGNLTLVGSMANIIVMERSLKKEKRKIKGGRRRQRRKRPRQAMR